MNVYQVWYMNQNWFRSGICGDLPDPKQLLKTHTPVAVVRANSHQKVFEMMQGEVWSPNGEARELIDVLGLGHTSMCTGDIVIGPQQDIWVVQDSGWKMIGRTR